MQDRFRDFQGAYELCLDKKGRATASFHYVYSGEPFTVSELGLRFLLDESCQEIAWRRRTEWDVYPEDHIGRPQGRALAHAGAEGKNGDSNHLGKNGDSNHLFVAKAIHLRLAPTQINGCCPHFLPWCLDANRYGTRDFRATKYNIYEAELAGAGGRGLRTTRGIRVESDGNASVRACLADGCVQFHVLVASPPPRLASGDQLTGEFFIELVSSGKEK